MPRAMAALTNVSERPTRTASGTARKASEKTEKALARCDISCVIASIWPCSFSLRVALGATCQPLSMVSRSSEVVSQRSLRWKFSPSLKTPEAANSREVVRA